MTTRHAVVSGASIAGLSAAYWLRHIGWRVTVIEKADAFREGGQNVDVRGVAHEVLDRMQLTDAVRAHNTTETATVLVDGAGDVITEIPSDGPDGATAELEVLRGDLAGVLRDALPDGGQFRWGDPIASVVERGDDVEITTESGHVLSADLLVVAEGVRSHTRDLLFGDDVEPEPLGITMAFGTIERIASDDDRWRWHNAVGGRQVHLRPDNHGTTRALLAFDDTGDDLDLTDLGRDDLEAELRTRFGDAGWQAARILDGFATATDLYVDRLTRIEMPRWHRGRVCVAGDAAWCVTPLGGGGASLALTSGYVLAAYLSTHDDVTDALHRYEQWLRPVVDAVPKFSPALRRLAYPHTRVGLLLSGLGVKAMTSAPMAALAERFTHTATSEQELPDIAAAR